MAPPTRWQSMLDASTAEASLAVRLYNDPSEQRSFEGFVVHMHLAWLYLLHAEFTRQEVDFRYWDKKGSRPRLVRVDGEPKCWELMKCVQERWPILNGIRANLEFFIALRNKIEHRYAREQSAMAVAVAAYSQALLLNYEEEITSYFGVRWSMATRLRFPVFIGTFTDEGEAALVKLHRSLPRPLQRFMAEYHSGLTSEVQNDSRFQLRLRISLALAKSDPDAMSVKFVRFDDMTDAEKAEVEEMGKRGQVVIREQMRPVLNQGYLKPSQARAMVADRISFRFTQNDFTLCWKKFKVRPASDDPHKERTDEKYCIFDSTHGDYVYTEAYVSHLVKRLGTEEGFRAILGGDPELSVQVETA